MWAYDFAKDRMRERRRFRMLNVVDELTRECLCIRAGRKLKAADATDVLSDLFIARGTPGHIRSDTGPKFTAVAVTNGITAEITAGMKAPACACKSPAAVGLRAIRERADLTQAAFARRFRGTVGAVRNWEQGRRQPEAAARVLLMVSDKHPDMVAEVLKAA